MVNFRWFCLPDLSYFCGEMYYIWLLALCVSRTRLHFPGEEVECIFIIFSPSSRCNTKFRRIWRMPIDLLRLGWAPPLYIVSLVRKLAMIIRELTSWCQSFVKLCQIFCGVSLHIRPYRNRKKCLDDDDDGSITLVFPPWSEQSGLSFLSFTFMFFSPW